MAILHFATVDLHTHTLTYTAALLALFLNNRSIMILPGRGSGLYLKWCNFILHVFPSFLYFSFCLPKSHINEKYPFMLQIVNTMP